MGTEILFGKSEIRLDSPVKKPPDGQITTRQRERIPFMSRTRRSIFRQRVYFGSGRVRRMALKSSVTPLAGGGVIVPAVNGGTTTAEKRCVAPRWPNSVAWTTNSDLTNREARAAILSIPSIQSASPPKHRVAHPRLTIA